MNNPKPQENNVNDAIKAGLIGAAVGAAATAAGVALSNEKNRQKIKDAAVKVKGKAEEIFTQVQDQAQEIGEETEDKVATARNRVNKKAEEVRKND